MNVNHVEKTHSSVQKKFPKREAYVCAARQLPDFDIASSSARKKKDFVNKMVVEFFVVSI